MEKLFNSTRDKNNKLTPSKAIIKGLSDDGGLFVPEFLDEVKFDYKDFIGKSYNYIAKTILGAFSKIFSISKKYFFKKSLF